jgi:hypothetical protein
LVNGKNLAKKYCMKCCSSMNNYTHRFGAEFEVMDDELNADKINTSVKGVIIIQFDPIQFFIIYVLSQQL